MEWFPWLLGTDFIILLTLFDPALRFSISTHASWYLYVSIFACLVNIDSFCRFIESDVAVALFFYPLHLLTVIAPTPEFKYFSLHDIIPPTIFALLLHILTFYQFSPTKSKAGRLSPLLAGPLLFLLCNFATGVWVPIQHQLFKHLLLAALSLLCTIAPTPQNISTPSAQLVCGALLLVLRRELQSGALVEFQQILFLAIPTLLVCYAMLCFTKHQSLLRLATQMALSFCFIPFFSEFYNDQTAFLYAASLWRFWKPTPYSSFHFFLQFYLLFDGFWRQFDGLVSPLGLAASGLTVVFDIVYSKIQHPQD